jgi:hypothetical protein
VINDNANLRYSKAALAQQVLKEAQADDLAYMLQAGDKLRTGWMPFQLAEFVAILTECMIEAEGQKFLEIGSGVGTKCLVARELFGLQTTGIEYYETLATIAEQKGRGPVINQDVLTYPGNFGEFDIIWTYGPFKDRVMQEDMEQRIYREMKPGAIIAGGHLENRPHGLWIPVLDDWDTGHRGAWKKLA